MSLLRIPEYPTKQKHETVEDYMKRLRDRMQEEAADRIQDFDILQLNNVGWKDVREYGTSANALQDGFANAITSISTTETTLLIPNQQDVTADATVPATLTLRFMQGGSLNISDTKTVTINGNLEAGLYQIFEGDGSVSFGNATIKIIPQWWGASSSASAATNSTAINASIVALPNYGSWELPGGEYDISTLITVSTKTNCTMNFIGRLMAQSCSGISFEAINRCTINGIYIHQETGVTWDSAYYGIKLKDFDNTNLTIKGTVNFGKALYLDGDASGISYNEIHPGWLYNSKYGIYIRSVNNGWVNENNYYGGNLRLSVATKAAESGGWGVYFVDAPSYTFNNHRFYGPCFENHHNGMNIQHCVNLTLITPRFESVDANWVDGSGGTEQFVWILGVPDFDESKVSFGNNSRSILILGSGTEDSDYRPIITDNRYGGLSFASMYDFSNVVSHLLVKSNNPSGLRYQDISGNSQYFNKAYQYSAAPSTAKDTFGSNTVVWNTNVASGQAMGWVCSQQGTAGTLSGVTGSITNGTKKLTVNAASNLLEGMFITIVGVTGVKNIEYIDGNDVYIYVAADATVAGAAVAYSTPTWVTMPNYP